MREGWYKQIRSQRDRKELAEDFRVPQPPYELILTHLATAGRETETLRRWLQIAGYETRRKDDFVRGLSKNVERGGNESVAVESFDRELAMKPLSVSGKLLITIRSDAILASMKRAEKDALRKRSNRGGGKCNSVADLQRTCNGDATKMQRGIEDSSGIAGDCPAEIPRVRKDKKNIFSKEKDILCADAFGVEAPTRRAEKEDPWKDYWR